MLKKSIDTIDKNLIKLLSKDGRVTHSNLSNKLSLTNPTVRSRIKSLVKAGIFKVSGLINSSTLPDITVAIVGINIDSKDSIDISLKKISELREVQWAAVVTGKYDIIAEVVSTENMQGLYTFTCESLPRLITPNVRSEAFVIMKSKNKFLSWIDGLDPWLKSTSKTDLSEKELIQY